MGFRIRKSISLGKGLRLNLGKSGVTSVTMGKRGAPHVTVGKGGTRFGTPIIPGTGISYETRLDKPSKKARRKNTTMGSQKEPAYTPSTFPTPTQQLPPRRNSRWRYWRRPKCCSSRQPHRQRLPETEGMAEETDDTVHTARRNHGTSAGGE